MFGYHVTFEHHLKSIMEKGLIPQVPMDYGDNGDTKGIYFFPSIDDAKNALYNWFGQRIEEMEEENNTTYTEYLLKVDLTELEFIDNTDFFPEYIVLNTIPPSKIENLGLI